MSQFYVFPKLTQPNGKVFNINIYLIGFGLISAKWFTCMYVMWVASRVGESFCVYRNVHIKQDAITYIGELRTRQRPFSPQKSLLPIYHNDWTSVFDDVSTQLSSVKTLMIRIALEWIFPTLAKNKTALKE